MTSPRIAFRPVGRTGLDSRQPQERNNDYWSRMKQREKESSGIELSTLCRQLKRLWSIMKAREVKTEPNSVVHILCTTETNLGGFGRWAFLEVADPWDAQNLIRAGLKKGTTL